MNSISATNRNGSHHSVWAHLFHSPCHQDAVGYSVLAIDCKAIVGLSPTRRALKCLLFQPLVPMGVYLSYCMPTNHESMSNIIRNHLSYIFSFLSGQLYEIRKASFALLFCENIPGVKVQKKLLWLRSARSVFKHTVKKSSNKF